LIGSAKFGSAKLGLVMRRLPRVSNAPIFQEKAADRDYLRGCLASAGRQEKGGFGETRLLIRMAAHWRLSPNLLLRTRAGIETQPPEGAPAEVFTLSPS